MQLNCILHLPKIYNIKRILEKQIIMEDIKPYEPKPQTWHHAGWLPMLVTCLVVGIAFSFGISYNNSTLKAKSLIAACCKDSCSFVTTTVL